MCHSGLSDITLGPTNPTTLTLYVGILYGSLPTSTASHSNIFVGPPNMRALCTQSPPLRQSYAPDGKSWIHLTELTLTG